MWGSAVSGLPTDDELGIRTIGWWGMTETISHGIVGDLHLPNRPGAIGRPAPEYGVAVLRPDLTPVDPGETGELRVHGVPGLSLFAGYLHQPEATAAAYDESGWFRTGDRVTPFADGHIAFADRQSLPDRARGRGLGAHRDPVASVTGAAGGAPMASAPASASWNSRARRSLATMPSGRNRIMRTSAAPNSSSRLSWNARSFSGRMNRIEEPSSAPLTVPMPPSTTAASSRIDSRKV